MVRVLFFRERRVIVASKSSLSKVLVISSIINTSEELAKLEEIGAMEIRTERGYLLCSITSPSNQT